MDNIWIFWIRSGYIMDIMWIISMASQRQNGFFCFFFVEVVLRVTKANQASPRSKMGRSLQW